LAWPRTPAGKQEARTQSQTPSSKSGSPWRVIRSEERAPITVDRRPCLLPGGPPKGKEFALWRRLRPRRMPCWPNPGSHVVRLLIAPPARTSVLSVIVFIHVLFLFLHKLASCREAEFLNHSRQLFLRGLPPAWICSSCSEDGLASPSRGIRAALPGDKTAHCILWAQGLGFKVSVFPPDPASP